MTVSAQTIKDRLQFIRDELKSAADK